MTDERPTPEQMLARVQTEGAAENTAARRGKLKLFFGYAAGVGKTFAMLQAAQALRAGGTDVVAGYVEPHGRSETEALLEGLPERSRVLEIGAGTGRDTGELARRGHHAVALDASPEAWRLAARAEPSLRARGLVGGDEMV